MKLLLFKTNSILFLDPVLFVAIRWKNIGASGTMHRLFPLKHPKRILSIARE